MCGQSGLVISRDQGMACMLQQACTLQLDLGSEAVRARSIQQGKVRLSRHREFTDGTSYADIDAMPWHGMGCGPGKCKQHPLTVVPPDGNLHTT